MRGLIALFASAATLQCAWGAGYGLKESSARAMGAAYAGAAASDGDSSFLPYNPATLSGVAADDASFSLVAILPGSRAAYTNALTSAGTSSGGATTPSGFISDALVPGFALRHRLSPQWTVGISLSAPWGLRTDYPVTWAGRYEARRSELLTINATPVVAYQPWRWLSLGVGAQIEFGQGSLSSAVDTGTLGALNGIPGSMPGAEDSVARVSGKNWTFGYSAGVLARPWDGVSLGIAYRSSLQHDLKGPLAFTLDSAGVGATIRALTGAFANTRATAALTMPDMITAGARIGLDGGWTVMAELDWTHWSRVRAISIVAQNPAQPTDVTTLNWHNTLFGSLGVEYRASPLWTLRAGAGYDESPVRDTTREPRIPDASRVWISGGVTYRWSDAVDLSATISRLINPSTPVALSPALPGAALRGTLAGTTQSYVNVAGLEMGWHMD